jgi:hypothetical protein
VRQRAGHDGGAPSGVDHGRRLTLAQTQQIKAIEQTKLTVKKRRGVVPFVSVFPVRLTFLRDSMLNDTSSLFYGLKAS